MPNKSERETESETEVKTKDIKDFAVRVIRATVMPQPSSLLLFFVYVTFQAQKMLLLCAECKYIYYVLL